jgi:ribosomal protein S18 acetylase RimI-like enzyme
MSTYDIPLIIQTSNKVALDLYSKTLNYRVAKEVPYYYADYEDAAYMTVDGLLPAKSSVATSTTPTAK